MRKLKGRSLGELTETVLAEFFDNSALVFELSGQNDITNCKVQFKDFTNKLAQSFSGKRRMSDYDTFEDFLNLFVC